jgi:glycosyltransferase involved in cell wall biosynthesis
VGSHQDRTLAQELIHLGSQYPGILLEGALTHAQTLRQITHVHALIQSSVSEGGALVVPEALACRCPVIASDIAAHRAQLGADYPGLFPVGNVEVLAQHLVRFIADEEFSRSLRQSSLALAPRLTSPAHERDALVRLVRQLADAQA